MTDYPTTLAGFDVHEDSILFLYGDMGSTWTTSVA